MIVLFWDIDLTLLTTGRAGMLAWDDACRDVTGQPVDLDLPTAGLTDHQVGIMILQAAGHEPSDAALERLMSVYEQQLPVRLPERKGSVLANVVEILSHLKSHRPDVHSVLLTGNTRAGAGAKLGHYGLQQFFDDGAFSEDTGPRAGIAARGLALATARLGAAPSGSRRVYVIGDTPHDITAGNAIGARTIAVATGVHSAEELATHGPWRTLSSLPSPDEFERLIDTEADADGDGPST